MLPRRDRWGGTRASEEEALSKIYVSKGHREASSASVRKTVNLIQSLPQKGTSAAEGSREVWGGGQKQEDRVRITSLQLPPCPSSQPCWQSCRRSR